MSIDIEYAIKKDVRNNPVVRGVDVQQRREFARGLLLAGAIVGMLLFSAWQHYLLIDHSINVQRLLGERVEAERLNRQLRLEVEALRAPARLESRAIRELGMVYPAPDRTLVIERVTSSSAPAASVVASAR